MRKRVDRIVFFARHTAFVGTEGLYSAPVDVRAYGDVTVVGFQGTGLGGTPASVEYTLQRSADLSALEDEGSLTPDAGEEAALSLGLRLPWLRAKAAVTGADPGVTGWLVGEFVRREDAAGEAA